VLEQSGKALKIRGFLVSPVAKATQICFGFSFLHLFLKLPYNIAIIVSWENVSTSF
jgi:hypothetical protein